MFTAEVDYQQVTLGTDVEQGQVLQAVVPKGLFLAQQLKTQIAIYSSHVWLAQALNTMTLNYSNEQIYSTNTQIMQISFTV